MRHWIITLREVLRVNFWLIPSAMVLAAVALAVLMLQLDAQLDGRELLQQMGWRLASGADGARQVLATIAGSMITITSITFSLTILALQLASTQFGPRLLRNFMADRGTQVVLGTFIATFTYCLLILRSVHAGDDEFIPDLSVLLAVVFAVAALGVLIFFIHHMATSIQADHVIKQVSRELKQALERLFPESLGPPAAEPRDTAALLAAAQNAVPVICTTSNYLQAIDAERLMQLACQHDLVLWIEQRPGRFLLEGVVLARVWPQEHMDTTLGDAIRETFSLGPVRSPLQDAEFAVDQLVEIAVRALSPGINDPYTAITCVDRLAEALKQLSKRGEPSGYRADQEGKLRIIAESESFAGIAESCFDQIRQAASGIPAVLIRILQRIIDLAPSMHVASARAALREQVIMIGHSSRQAIQSGKDLRDIERRCQLATQLLGEQASAKRVSGAAAVARKSHPDRTATVHSADETHSAGESPMQ